MDEQGPGDVLAMDSGRLRLEFRTEAGRITLSRIGGADGENWLAGPTAALWRLDLRGPDGPVEVAGDRAAARSAVLSREGARLAWTLPLAGMVATVTVTVRLARGSALSYWSISADLPDGYAVERADFPLLPDLAMREGLKLAVPTGWGLAYDVAPGLSVEAPYPSCHAAMAFTALYGHERALYLGTHDEQAHFKTFTASADGKSLSLTCAHWPALAEGRFRLPYDVALGIVPGGWYEAAQVYRDFALAAPWARTPLAERYVPRWLLDTELWLKPGETPWTDDDAECRRVTFRNVDTCVRAKVFFGVPIALHWYRWHKIPYDALYPEYFPPKAGFVDGVKAAQAEKFPVMPYINGRLCDPESPTWKAGGSEWAARDEAGQPYTEVYGSNVPLNVMCPGTRPWRDTVESLVRRLFEEVGVNGVYIDQIGAAPPFRCLRTDHGHAPGGGTMWVEGYRTLLDEARRHVPEGGILTTEENAEPWMDQLDGYLVVNTPTNLGEVIPLFPAVYAGRCVNFGFQYTPPAEPPHSLGFRSKMARAFLWGAQLGWIDAARLMAPDAREAAGFVRAMCRTRRHGHDFLLYGRFLGLLDLGGDNPRLTSEAVGSFGGTYTLDLPAVMASAWQSEDGRLGIALANMDDAPHTVTLDLPLAAGLASGAEVQVIGPDGPVGSMPAAGTSVCLDIPARDARLLVATG